MAEVAGLRDFSVEINSKKVKVKFRIVDSMHDLKEVTCLTKEILK